MPQLLYLGLFLALLATPLLLALFKWLHFDSFSLVPRLALWLTAAAVLVIAAAEIAAWRAHLGLEWPTWQSVGLAILAAAILFLAFGVSQYLQGKFGIASSKQVEQYQKLLRLPFSHRCFVVVTAAVTEEVLYRGYAIGVGQHLLGSVWLACSLSIAVFTLMHFRWGLAHLVPVFASTLVLTLLFAFTGNLWVCILAHAIIDGAGFLVLPAVMARRPPSSARQAG